MKGIFRSLRSIKVPIVLLAALVGSGSYAVEPVSVVASADDGNVPGNTIDNDLATRWSALGDGQWI